MQKIESPASAGGAGGPAPESATVIDLRKPGDVALVLRAVLNGWDVPEHMRAQICEQIVPALAALDAEPGRSGGGRRVLKLAKLVLAMEVRSMIDEGHRPSHFPYVRKRYPEQRRPQRERPAANVRPMLKLPPKWRPH